MRVCVNLPETPTRITSWASRTIFGTKTAAGKNLLPSDRNARRFIDVLRHYVNERKCAIEDFVVQRAFSKSRVEVRTTYLQHREYIAQNPIWAAIIR
jgi:hypothetical protein